MENASKALIIAGAILISILLISLGIMIYNQAKTVTDSQQMDAVAIQQYNAQFEQYSGTKKSGAQVRALVNQVMASNSLDENQDRQVELTGVVQGKTNVDTSQVRTTSKYTVKLTYDTSNGANNGLVTSIDVSQ